MSGLRGRVSLDDVDLLDESEVEVLEGEVILKIPKSEIYSVEQVRKSFDPIEIEEMARSLENEGQIQPIIVSARDSKGYCIQKGERRWRGANASNEITHLHCIVRAPGTIWGQLAENIIRADLTPFEVGSAIEKGKVEFELDNKAVAQRLGISTSKVSAFLKAIQAPEIVKKAYDDGVVGDVDTINSLRIAHELDPNSVEGLINSSEVVSRKQAQDLTKELKGKESGTTAESESHSNSTRMKKTKKAASIKVLVNGKPGVVDMSGDSDEGELVVILDDTRESISVSCSSVNIVGYYYS